MATPDEQNNMYNNEDQDGSPLKSSIILERQQGPFPTNLYSPNRPQMMNNVTVTNSIAAYRPSFAPQISNYSSVPTNNGTMPAYLTSPTRTTLPTYITSPYRMPLVSNGYGEREDAYAKPVAQHIASTPYGLYSPGRRTTSFAPVYAQSQPTIKYESQANYASYNMGAPVSPMYSPISPNAFNPVPPRNTNNTYSIRAQPSHTQYSQPAQTQYSQPAQTQYSQPAQTQYSQPAHTQYSQPANSQYSPVTQRRDSSYLGAPGPATYGRSSVAPSYGHGSLNYGSNTYGSQLGASTAYGSIRMTCTDQVGRLGKKPKRKYVH
jgi:hypothetical protein